MDNDTMILEAIKRGFLKVDFEEGLVYSQRFQGKQSGCLTRFGYKVFTLHLDGARRQLKIHRVIWIAKNGVPPVGSMIDHINRNKSDNRLVNLRLADAGLNASNRRDYKGEGNPSAKINRQTAQSIRDRYVSVKSYAKVSSEFNVSKSLVAQIIKGKLWNQ